ncbi:MAG: isoprenylcysteine carboxylmethyltransferase family protein [Acidobacteriota bacterium]
MELSTQLYLGLLLLVAGGRLIELAHSRRNQQRLAAAGSVQAQEPAYKWMVALHTGVLAMCAVEVVVLRRPWIPMLGFPALLMFLGANAARWWVIRTLGPRWNVQVMPAALGVITDRGPYRWVRHPNYAAVFVEMLALPLIHTAWITALVGAGLHILVLRNRIALEESVMQLDPQWRGAFEHRARFVPGIL